jgi:Zn-dependent membrane protease YugP
MPYAILTLALLLLIYFPSIWVRIIMRRHARQRDDLPGTGGELAVHLIARFELEGVTVEQTESRNDHYDPNAGVVRLSPENFNGKSLTAVAVAAHEVGHAIQFKRGESISLLRKKYLPSALRLKKAGIVVFTLVPVIAFVVKVPALIVGTIAIGLVLQLLGALAYLIVLPEEWDASFSKALPILVDGDYVNERDLPAVSSVLKAAVLTYFASALADLVNIGRWLLILRR